MPFIQRGNRKSHYDMSWVKPKPLVKRRHCFEIVERIERGRHRSSRRWTRHEPNRVAREIAATARDRSGRRMLLFSYINPAHELRVKEIFAEEARRACQCRSLSKCCRNGRSTSAHQQRIADAYIKPIVSRQLRHMRQRFTAAGVDRPGRHHQVQRWRNDARGGVDARQSR